MNMSFADYALPHRYPDRRGCVHGADITLTVSLTAEGALGQMTGGDASRDCPSALR